MHHDRNRFSTTCYSGVACPDAMTDELRRQVNRWRNVRKLSDDQLASIIREDRIDILVDLSLHLRGNRLLTFARKPAPIQVTWLAYSSTSGLQAMDYRFTDPYLDPDLPKRNEMYVERSVRLKSFWCYQPPADSPDVTDPPCRANEFVTFGCFNNFCKVTSETLELWRRILQQIPDSRLLLHAPEGSPRQRVLDVLNVGIDRIQFVGRVSHEAYLRAHSSIDMALDPSPCTGGTTTCDALWMGVPVVSLVGDTAVARSGLSILSRAGLGELATHSPDQYVAMAFRLAKDIEWLSHLRTTLRNRLLASPLLNAAAFTEDVESNYRAMWLEYVSRTSRLRS